jgi:hypothetical protein
LIDEKLVAKSPSIFEAFRAQNKATGCGKNEILRASGSKDKPLIFKTIEFLKTCKILEFEKLRQGKKGMVKLTPLGKEILDLTTDIYLSNVAFKAVETNISKYLPLIEEDHTLKRADEYDGKYPSKTLQQKLLQIGWKQEELDSFDQVIQSLHKIGDIYRKNVCNSLLHRYSTILSNFQMNKNAGAVLIKIILNEINRLLISRPIRYDNAKQSDFSAAYHFPFDKLQIPILKDIEQTYKNKNSIQIISNRFTSEVISSLMSSLICIMKPSQDEFSTFINAFEMDTINKELESFKKKTKKVEQAKRYLHNLEELAKVRKKCLKRYRKDLADDSGMDDDDVLVEIEKDQLISP